MEAKELIARYFETIKDKYPDIPFEEVDLMCRSVFSFVKKMMARTDILHIIRLQYLGVFTINFGSAVAQYKGLDKALEEERIPEERYHALKKSLPIYIKNHRKFTKEYEYLFQE